MQDKSSISGLVTDFTDKEHLNQSCKGRIHVCFHIKGKANVYEAAVTGNLEKASNTYVCEVLWAEERGAAAEAAQPRDKKLHQQCWDCRQCDERAIAPSVYIHTQTHTDTHPLALHLYFPLFRPPQSQFVKKLWSLLQSHTYRISVLLWQPRLVNPYVVCQPWFCRCSSSYFHPSIPSYVASAVLLQSDTAKHREEHTVKSWRLWWGHTLFENIKGLDTGMWWMVLQLHSVAECSQCSSGENRLVACCAVLWISWSDISCPDSLWRELLAREMGCRAKVKQYLL